MGCTQDAVLDSRNNEVPISCQYLNLVRIKDMRRRCDYSGDDIRKGTSIIIEVCITSLNLHFPHHEPQHMMLRRKKRNRQDSPLSWIKPRYCGRFSRDEVWIKVCNANFQEVSADFRS
jgi:hypothetical protein